MPSIIDFKRSQLSPWALQEELHYSKQKFDIENYYEMKQDLPNNNLFIKKIPLTTDTPPPTK